METNDRITIEADCTRLMNEFALCSDTFEYDRAIALFVPECTFSRADVAHDGHEGLRAALDRRDRNRITRHIVSNILIDVEDGDHATGQAYSLVFSHRGPLSESGEAPLGTPDSLITYEATFVRTDAGWRIKTWHIGLSFRKPAP